MNESSITFWTNNIRNVSVLKQSLWYIVSENLLSSNEDWAKKKWLILMKETLNHQEISVKIFNDEIVICDVCSTDSSFKHDYFFEQRSRAISSMKQDFCQC